MQPACNMNDYGSQYLGVDINTFFLFSYAFLRHYYPRKCLPLGVSH